MIQYLSFNTENNIYEFGIAYGQLNRLDDHCLYFIRAEKAGTYRNFKGDLITVLPDDILFVRRGIVCSAINLSDTIVYIEELENNRNLENGCCCEPDPNATIKII